MRTGNDPQRINLRDSVLDSFLSVFPNVEWHCLKTDKTSKTNFPGLKYFVCVVICSACQDIHEHHSQDGELIKYICVCV